MIWFFQPFFVERVFHIFDKDDNGSISLQEFIDAMHQFAGQSPDDKIKFLFKVYDIDGRSKAKPLYFYVSIETKRITIGYILNRSWIRYELNLKRIYATEIWSVTWAAVEVHLNSKGLLKMKYDIPHQIWMFSGLYLVFIR